jgi:hypothetical protein
VIVARFTTTAQGCFRGTRVECDNSESKYAFDADNDRFATTGSTARRFFWISLSGPHTINITGDIYDTDSIIDRVM